MKKVSDRKRKEEKMTKTEKLRRALKKIAKNHVVEIKSLKFTGPRGGHNARVIPGWSRSTANITRAGGLPMLNWWDGSAPTPSTGIPTCCANEAYKAEKEIFDENR